MIDKHADKSSHAGKGQTRRSRESVERIHGDPGVGGLLANPEEPVAKPKLPPKSNLGPPTPDPELPRAHGDWAPNRAWHGQAGDKAKPGDKITGN
jgi:hypothetical protein